MKKFFLTFSLFFLSFMEADADIGVNAGNVVLSCTGSNGTSSSSNGQVLAAYPDSWTNDSIIGANYLSVGAQAMNYRVANYNSWVGIPVAVSPVFDSDAKIPDGLSVNGGPSTPLFRLSTMRGNVATNSQQITADNTVSITQGGAIQSANGYLLFTLVGGGGISNWIQLSISPDAYVPKGTYKLWGFSGWGYAAQKDAAPQTYTVSCSVNLTLTKNIGRKKANPTIDVSTATPQLTCTRGSECTSNMSINISGTKVLPSSLSAQLISGGTMSIDNTELNLSEKIELPVTAFSSEHKLNFNVAGIHSILITGTWN
ncbi:hypothetical protein I3A70_14060 [Salmonella enterica]|nr:hypothetical protein [Salmonella enterica]